MCHKSSGILSSWKLLCRANYSSLSSCIVLFSLLLHWGTGLFKKNAIQFFFSCLVSIAVVNVISKTTGEGKSLFHLMLLGHNASLKGVGAGTKAGAETGTMDGCCLSARSATFLIQPRAHGLHHTAIEKMPPQTCWKTSLLQANPQLETLFYFKLWASSLMAEPSLQSESSLDQVD